MHTTVLWKLGYTYLPRPSKLVYIQIRFSYLGHMHDVVKYLVTKLQYKDKSDWGPLKKRKEDVKLWSRTFQE